MLDLTCPNFTILVGASDISPHVTGFSFRHPLAEPSTPLIWTGQIELDLTVDTSLGTTFFDDRVNPSRWLSGLQPIDVYFEGVWWQRFRIKPNGYRYDIITGQAVIEITDIIGLLESYTPAADAPQFKTGFDNPWNLLVVSLIRKQAELMGISVTVNTPNYGIGGNFKVPRTVQGSYLQEAQKMLGERGQWMWCDKEVIRFATYPLYGGSPIFRKSKQELLNYKRQQGLEPVVAEITVSATHEDVDTCTEVYPKTITEYADGVAITNTSNLVVTRPYKRVSAITRIDKAVTNSTVTLTTEKSGIPAIALFGGFVNNFNQIKVEIPSIKGYKETKLGGTDYWIEYSYQTRNYPFPTRFNWDWTQWAALLIEYDVSTYEDVPITSQNPSKILTSVITRAEPLIKRNINIFEGYDGGYSDNPAYSSSYWLSLGFYTERVTTKYTYVEIFRTDIIVRTGQKLYEIASVEEIKEQLYFEKRANHFDTNGKPIGYYFAPRFVPAERTITTYRKECQGQWEESKTVSINKGQSKTTAGYLYQVQNTVQKVTSIPDIPYRPIPFPVIQKPLLATVSTGYAGISPFVQNRDFKSSSTLTTKGELENYARMLGVTRWQRYYSYEIAAGYQTVLNYQPFQTVDAGDGRFIRDRFGVSLNYEDESWQFVEDCIGNLVGNITAIAPPQIPYPPLLLSNLAVCTIATTTVRQDQSFSIALSASGGTAPYQFRLDPLPQGVYIAGNVLAGSPKTMGTTLLTLTVYDAAYNSKSSTFWFIVIEPDVTPLPTPSPPTPAPTSTLNIGSVPTQNFVQNTPIESITFTAAGGVAPYTFSSTSLPSGLSLSSGGVLSGTATAIATTSVTITVTDAIASSANTAFNIVVSAPVVPAIITTEPIELGGTFEIQSDITVVFGEPPIELGGTFEITSTVGALMSYTSLVIPADDSTNITFIAPLVIIDNADDVSGTNFLAVNFSADDLTTITFIDSPPPNPLLAKTLAYFKFDDNSSNLTSYDSTGLYRFYFPSYNATFSAGLIGNSVSCSALGGNITTLIDTLGNLENAKFDMTATSFLGMAVWVKFNSYPTSFDGKNWTSTTGFAPQFDLTFMRANFGSHITELTVYDSSGLPYTISVDFSTMVDGELLLSTWYLFNIELDSTAGTYSFRISDSAIAVGTGLTSYYDSYSGGSANATLSISGNYTDVEFDEMYFYNSPLTTTEWTNLYNAGAGLAYPF